MSRTTDEAGDLRVGYQLGLVSRHEVIAWADDVIASAAEPPYEVIELALMSSAHPQDILSKLRELSPAVTTVSVLPRVLGNLAYRLRDNPALGRGVARALWVVYVESGYDVPPELNSICCFDEDYALAEEGGYGTEAQVFHELLTFAESFKDTA